MEFLFDSHNFAEPAVDGVHTTKPRHPSPEKNCNSTYLFTSSSMSDTSSSTVPKGVNEPSPSSADTGDTHSKKPPQRVGRYAGANLRPHPSRTSTSLTRTTAVTPSETRHVPVRRFTPVPVELLADPELEADMSALPDNYSFELPKTIHRLREAEAKCAALQMPEGLLLYATTISDIITKHTSVTSTVILGDVTYGACCVDDLSARSLGCDFLVHYGHSCLVPISTTCIPTMYVFVHISFDTSHLCAALKHNFDSNDRIALVATIQFVDTAHEVREALKDDLPSMFVPQKRPLSPGELLGCTAPQIHDADVMVYIGDGRFHLESAMIANPGLRALRYDPYGKRMTEERYAIADMHDVRKKAIAKARAATAFGVVLGTLGRQGSTAIMDRVTKALSDAGKPYFVVLLSEITVEKLNRMEAGGVSAWVQIACPRLSIDWGEGFSTTPLLTPYECFVALGKVEWKEVYPMDYYAKDGGQWSNYYKKGKNDLKKGEKAKTNRLSQKAAVPATTIAAEKT